ncbi:M48 family peptidase [Rhodovarius crocodyli]|uniref:M48 family peptidase n=1 Tax=Rhodovarius crocodyli TaxID=1979269 RepID=A0A437MNH1_9PROT|nr:SprT family zinc-dependent metalloprotease [Rhodovarius crocodyli]RVT99179.1 M48 family peptidase [Rhodovarius crocodyli]
MEPAESETILLQPNPFAAPAPCAVHWRRSARARRVSLKIDPREAAVVVTLPQRAARRMGMALLHQHAGWVLQRLAALTPVQKLEPGASLPIGDVQHEIVHAPDRRAGVAIEDGRIVVSGGLEFLPRRILDFLREEAARRVRSQAPIHAAALGVRPRALRVKDTSSRWGSCAPDGTLAFSWRLVMAPDWVLDYVVAHEIAHLRELNHSPRFWAHVESLTPHRRAAEAWLKRHGPALLRVG